MCLGQQRTPYRPIQMTVPETPSPELLAAQAQQQAVAGVDGASRRGGPGRNVSDTTPGKGRVAKAARVDTESGSGGAIMAAAGGALYEGRGTYSDVIGYAERLFGRIRQSVRVWGGWQHRPVRPDRGTPVLQLLSDSHV
jgi:hypothetical protein